MEFPDVARFNRRVKTLDVAPLEGDRMRFETRLVDRSWGGAYEQSSCESLVLHDFRMKGTAAGADLILETLSVRAETHPFPQCPFIIPATEDLLSLSLMSGWRRNVLARFGGASGCTHVTTLLLGLSEVTTLMYFQRMNEHRVYGPKSLASGEWVAGCLDLGPELQGACHALDGDGPVVRRAEGLRERRS